MKEDAIFRIASQTKALVSVAALQLQEEGRLLIGDPVGKYIPEFQKTKVAVLRPGGYDVVDAKRPITIRDLLTHTSGVSYGDGPAKDLWQKAGITGWYFADRDEPVAATVTRMAALPFDAQPGEKYIYGFNTDILGVVVERASGQPLDEYLRTRIFEPLKMRDTHFYLPPAKADRLATVYSATPGGKIERAPTPGTMVSQGAYVEGPRKSFSGGAGIVSTALDYARFLQMMLNGGELEGARILGRKSVELMTVDLHRRAGDATWRWVRPRLLGPEGRGPARDPRLRWRIRLGRRLPLHVLGRPEGAARGRVLHAAPALGRPGRPRGAARAALSGHRGRASARVVTVRQP